MVRETSLELLMSRPVQERADAARNREKVLAAAARLFAEKGVDAVSMDAVAAEAGVGKGTLFRRFGDKAGLAVALLDDRERDLQQRILSGPPPLGPGAPARERLVAFVRAYLDFLFAHLDLVRMSETASPGARYRIGSYWFWHRHVAILLAQSRGGDADVLAHTLLAAMQAELADVLQTEYGRDRTLTALTTLATTLT
ncbi:Transcriptional regulator, TetR family [[Actinomadura] parvosata subsp. kistnae]|uniref:TetR family transcriptional regulator n=1 Tax=[Actinomadura] parvosata subsp. kistnae TaxID=1909395 RepID=A0A1V0A4E3_9ACTN|nr:TetR/AcrR family transcriptional regulator [Nonomuraea sp. ATCC 55076]AQZ65071.1 TetR family transcriptional regulator [Nonomuraea sp. ATCC 55076]SPL96337.1 Transcriptional regulator, TetR family [Actinomadura parvosata subsp. kistnae]